MANKNAISKENWISNFTLIGTPVITDKTFKIDAHSEKSDWIYNSISLGVDCGERHGTVWCEAMGGYASERENIIRVSNKEDPKQRIEVAWEDRFDDEIIENVSDFNLITVGLEKTTKGKIYKKKFLSAYDAIAYIEEHINSDAMIVVRGRLQFSLYNDNVQVKKVIDRIELAWDDAVPSATFTQSILLDKDSASFKNVDKDKGVMYVDARVLDYVKEVNGVEIRGQYPFRHTFEYSMDFSNQDKCKRIYDKLFKIKKGVTQITFEGEFIEGGATVKATYDDLPDEIKELVDIGVYTEEEACADCSTSGNRERHMVLKKPFIRIVGEDKVPTPQIFTEQYEEDDLLIDIDSDSDDEAPFDDANNDSADNDDDWLSML